MNALVAWIRSLPLPARWASIGALFAGLVGGIAGLVIGLFADAPTAPFAAVELGFPAVIAGGAVGLAAGVITTTARRVSHRGAS